MDISEEVRAAHKRELLAFLENDVGRMYMDDIKTMINHKRRRLIVDISDLHSFRDLAPRIDGKHLKKGETVLVGFEGSFVSRRVTPRELLSEFIGSMVCVEGIVTKYCGSHDPDLKQEIEKQFVDLLAEELKLQETVAEEHLRRMNITFVEAKRVTSQYQREVEKCNSATEIREEARERAEALLIKERKVTLMWEKQAHQMGWEGDRDQG